MSLLDRLLALEAWAREVSYQLKLAPPAGVAPHEAPVQHGGSQPQVPYGLRQRWPPHALPWAQTAMPRNW